MSKSRISEMLELFEGVPTDVMREIIDVVFPKGRQFMELSEDEYKERIEKIKRIKKERGYE